MKELNSGSGIKGLLDLPVIIAIIFTAIVVFLIETSVLNSTGFVFMYPLDDPFIHMQIAKNLAFKSTWGINPGEFASASSSLLYTLLLAAIFKVFSVHVIVPFVINCVAAFFLLIAINSWLKNQGLLNVSRIIILLILIFLVPLPVLIISGMEHTLQCLFCFLFITRFAGWLDLNLDKEPGIGKKLPWSIYLYAVIVIALRYEGMFLIAIACALLLFRRKIGSALLLGIIALLPVIIFGIYSLAKGSYFFPNSVLVKSEGAPLSVHGIIDFLYNILVNKLTVVKPETAPVGSPPPGISLLATQRLLIILPLAVCFFLEQIRRNTTYLYMILLLTLCTLLHLSFASTGWFYRYEAYLVICSLVILSVVLYKYGRAFLLKSKSAYSWILIVVLVFALGFPFILRSIAAYSKASRACINIYEQQYQMSAFLHKNFNNEVAAANDIGAISYYTNTKIVDLWGLGSITVARSKKGKYWTPVFLDSLVKAQQVKVAIVYDEWFDPQLLKGWKKVATWQISQNVICGSDTVAFYAVTGDSEELSRMLHEYQEQSLPGSIKVVYH